MMKVAVMYDRRGWIVDKMSDTIKQYAPPDIEFTDFDCDVKIDELLRLADKNDIIYSSFWQPFMRNKLVLDQRFPVDKVLIQVHHLIDHGRGRAKRDSNQDRLLEPTVKHIAYYCRSAQESLKLMQVKANLYKLNQLVDVDTFMSRDFNSDGKRLLVGNFNQPLPRKCLDILEGALAEMENVDLITTKAKVNDNEVKLAFSILDVYVSCSDVEGGPIGALDAMATGVPIVITPTGFAADIVKHGVNGFFMKFYDKDGLRERLEWIRDNRDEANKIGAVGKRTVAKFTPRAFSEQYISLFRRIKETNDVKII